MSVNTAGGCAFAIGPAGTPATLGEYQAESYIDVGEVEDLGQFGDASPAINFATLADGRERIFKGPRSAGTQTVVCGADSSEDGQTAMIAAEATPLDYMFRVTLNDQETLGGTPSVLYYHGKVMSKRLNVGNASNVVRRNFDVAVNSEVLEVAAT